MKNTLLIFNFFKVEKNYREVLRMCLTVFNDRTKAEDAVHDIFLKLIKSADRIKFPEEQKEAAHYILKAIKNHRNEAFRKSKSMPEKVDESKANNIDAEVLANPGIIRKLEKLDSLIRQKKKLFTPEQLKLWECMYECQSVEQIKKKLAKNRATLYSLRNKLLSKIRKNFKLEELI